MSAHTINHLENTDAYHEDALNSLIAADVALAHAPALAIDGPHFLTDVNEAFVESILSTGGAKLSSMTTADEHSGMTSRQKWTLNWDAAGQSAGLPKAIFVKSTPPEPAHREMLSVLHMQELEARFYNTIQPEIADIAPCSFYSEFYAGGRFLIVLEDLESSASKPYWIRDKASIEHVKAVTISLAKLHAKFWQSPRLESDLRWVRPRTCRYGWPWLNGLNKSVRAAFAETASEILLPETSKSMLQDWSLGADAVFKYMDTLPSTVLHGDSHLGNTFSYSDGGAGLFDWQLVFSGHGLRDFAYFLLSAIDEDDRKLHEKSIFNLYIDTLRDLGVVINTDEAWNLYCLFVLDHWDANITAFVHGSYNHDTAALERGLIATNGSIVENDIAGRLSSLMKKL